MNCFSRSSRATGPNTRVPIGSLLSFSDFHGTGANPAANASLTDAAYVANRFRVVQHRRHV